MSGKRSSELVDLGSLLVLGLMVLWFAHGMVWGGKVPFYRDLGPYFYPMRFSLAQSFGAGELPLWDRHLAMGFPLLANFQSGAFYPPHLLFLVLPFFGAIRALFVFHYLVAASGAYCLGRRWGYSPSLALMGGILFTFGGYTVSLTNLLNHFQTAVWLPWVILLGERGLSSKSRKDLLAFTLVLLLQFLAGSPEIYALSLGLFLVAGIACKKRVKDFAYRKLLYFFLLANGLVLALAMVQIVPTLELFMESGRSEALPYERATVWSLHPLGLINFFVLDKEVDLTLLRGFRLLLNPEIPWITSLYMGALALPGILFWLFNSSLRERIALLALILGTVILAMGSYTPVYYILYRYLPLLRLFRFPEKFLFITYALLLYIILRGFSSFLRSRGSPCRGWGVAVLAPVLLWLGLYLLLRVERDSLVQWVNQLGVTTPHLTRILENSTVILVHLERQTILGLGIFLILFLWKKGKLRTAVTHPLLVGLIFLDLATAHQPYQFLLDPGLISQNDRLLSAPGPEPGRLFYISRLSHLHPDFYIFNKRPFPEKVSSVFATLIPNTGVFYGFDYVQELDALARRPYNLFFGVASPFPLERLIRLLGSMNVKYVISATALPPEGLTLVLHYPAYPSWLYRLNRAVPRVVVVPNVIEEKDPLTILNRLSSTEFDPSTRVILEQPLPLSAEEDWRGEAQITRYNNRSVTIRAATSGPGVLVLADSFYPGWRVFVDGQEREVLRANFFFRGVHLSAGRHLVEFRYQPRSFTIGLSLSLASVLGILIWTFIFPDRGEAKPVLLSRA